MKQARINALKAIIGKAINSVVIRERENADPRCQLLLVFDDGTAFEFFCSREMIVPSKGCIDDDILKSPGDGVDVARVEKGERPL